MPAFLRIGNDGPQIARPRSASKTRHLAAGCETPSRYTLTMRLWYEPGANSPWATSGTTAESILGMMLSSKPDNKLTITADQLYVRALNAQDHLLLRFSSRREPPRTQSQISKIVSRRIQTIAILCSQASPPHPRPQRK